MLKSIKQKFAEKPFKQRLKEHYFKWSIVYGIIALIVGVLMAFFANRIGNTLIIIPYIIIMLFMAVVAIFGIYIFIISLLMVLDCKRCRRKDEGEHE